MGKGDNRRPELVKGAWDQNWERVFGQTEREWLDTQRQQQQAEDEATRGTPCS